MKDIGIEILIQQSFYEQSTAPMEVQCYLT